ncbi:TetR/AcrR family transcriptional regulator [Nocardia sp. NPDC052254]|uniref:TetR/AcrR family transcriptional regulator n=1 Tax=Nocardia sp. NPDC052254 TaxID=3155681 RepID=UPI00342A9942
MVRPRKPLITRDSIIAASIEMIDGDGIDSFSLPRVAKQLNVSTSSLYHHFSDRRELMAEVAKEIMRGARVPAAPADGDWMEWFVQLSLNYREAILRHANAALILVELLPRDVLTSTYEKCARILSDCGVAPALHVIILDGLEKLSFATILSSLANASAADGDIFPNVDAERHPVLSTALSSNPWSATELFEVTIRSFLSGVMAGSAHPAAHE